MKEAEVRLFQVSQGGGNLGQSLRVVQQTALASQLYLLDFSFCLHLIKMIASFKVHIYQDASEAVMVTVNHV